MQQYLKFVCNHKAKCSKWIWFNMTIHPSSPPGNSERNPSLAAQRSTDGKTLAEGPTLQPISKWGTFDSTKGGKGNIWRSEKYWRNSGPWMCKNLQAQGSWIWPCFCSLLKLICVSIFLSFIYIIFSSQLSTIKVLETQPPDPHWTTLFHSSNQGITHEGKLLWSDKDNLSVQAVVANISNQTCFATYSNIFSKYHVQLISTDTILSYIMPPYGPTKIFSNVNHPNGQRQPSRRLRIGGERSHGQSEEDLQGIELTHRRVRGRQRRPLDFLSGSRKKVEMDGENTKCSQDKGW